MPAWSESKIKIGSRLTDSVGVFVVADGMGGHVHGEVAAQVALTAIQFYIDSSRDRFDVSS